MTEALAKEIYLKNRHFGLFDAYSSSLTRVSVLAASVFWTSQLATLPAHAQTSQPIVMVCTNGSPGENIFTINLSSKSVLIQHIDPTPPPFEQKNSGIVTSVTDQEVVFIERGQDGRDVYRYELGRFTGKVSWRPLTSGGNNGSADCRRQEKLF